MTKKAIELHEVYKTFGRVEAVRQLSLTVMSGDILVLLGASGCGKTTLLRLIAGLEVPEGGKITLNEQVVFANGRWVEPEKRGLGMVFQDYALFPTCPLRTISPFRCIMPPRAQKAERTAELLQLVGLEGLDKRFPHELSGGQQQRVALARALSARPSVILLDEPFSNLDATLRKTMREEVRRILQQTHTTAVFVTHDQEEAMAIGDQIAVMQSGQVLQVGTPQEVYLQPNSLAVAQFLGEVNLLDGVAHGDSVDCALGTLGAIPPRSWAGVRAGASRVGAR
ncbi:MAG UNVERIFIED_CONTAM: ABC transporter ATP-binding protein [Anaerolineae bacterium]